MVQSDVLQTEFSLLTAPELLDKINFRIPVRRTRNIKILDNRFNITNEPFSKAKEKYSQFFDIIDFHIKSDVLKCTLKNYFRSIQRY